MLTAILIMLVAMIAGAVASPLEEGPSIADLFKRQDAGRFCRLVRIIVMEKDGTTLPRKDAIKQADCVRLFRDLHNAFAAKTGDEAFWARAADFCSDLARRSGVTRRAEQTLLCGVGVTGDRYEGVIGQLMFLKDSGKLSRTLICSNFAIRKNDVSRAVLAQIKAAVAADPKQGLAKLFGGLTDTQCTEKSCSIFSPYWFAPAQRMSQMTDAFSPYASPVEVRRVADGDVCIGMAGQ